jgi:ribosomal protein S18 acetylase RimI-like enzyme
MVNIRPATPADHNSIWRILEPTIRAGETYALPRDMTEADALAYWMGPGRETFVAAADGEVLGTFVMRPNAAGGGGHVANCGYMTAAGATGRGIARAMCAHSLQHAGAGGFLAMQFNFVVSSNTRAVQLWQSFGFEIVGRLPGAFLHPVLGYTDAYVMFLTL